MLILGLCFAQIKNMPLIPIFVAAVGDPVGEVPERQGGGLAQGREVLLQRVEQPRRRRAGTADCQGECGRNHS